MALLNILLDRNSFESKSITKIIEVIEVLMGIENRYD